MSHHSPLTGPGRRLARTAFALAIPLAFLTACGGGGDTDPGAAATSAEASTGSSAPASGSESPDDSGATQTITATEDDFSIALEEDSLTAGSYEIEVVNEGRASHDLVVERDGENVAASEIIAPGASTTLTVDLEPGEYVFYCSVGNHRGMGMEVTVQVT